MLGINLRRVMSMRGADQNQDGMFSYLSPAARVPKDHPLRPIKKMVNQALSELWHDFEAMYAREGRPSIPPEKLLRALLLQVLYTIRSERLLMEQLDYNLLFRWFVGLSMDDPVWDHSTFSKNRERFLRSDLAAAFFRRIQDQAAQAGLLSDEHFTVDGTLIEAWASMKSFRPQDEPPPATGGRNPEVDFHGERRRNATHASTTDPEARLFRKGQGKEAKLCFMGHVLMENRHGLPVDDRLTQATGTAEREAGAAMVQAIPGRHRITVGGDKAYDTREFVQALRSCQAVPHVARKSRGSAIDGRTTHHATYALSQRYRKLVEQIFGWLKTVGYLRKTRHRGVERVSWVFTFTLTGYLLVRLRNLQAAIPG
jgi:transposase